MLYHFQGIACDIASDSFKNLDDATREVVGESIPYSDTGSLPLVGDMQEAGFDIQVCTCKVFYSFNSLFFCLDHWLWFHTRISR